MRGLHCLLLCIVSCASARADYVLNLDDLAEGASANDVKAAQYGVSFVGLGDGGPFAVIADAACLGNLSAPHVFSIGDAAACPELNDLDGFIEVNFEVEQSYVSIRTVHNVSGTVSYLIAYDGPDASDFIDQVSGNSNVVGTAQTLRIDRMPQDSQIRRVRFGTYNLDNRRAAFDDLGFPNAPLAVSAQSWSAIKARW